MSTIGNGDVAKTLIWYWWRVCYLGIAVALIAAFVGGGKAWGLPFLAGFILAATAYQIAHRITYGRWFE